MSNSLKVVDKNGILTKIYNKPTGLEFILDKKQAYTTPIMIAKSDCLITTDNAIEYL